MSTLWPPRAARLRGLALATAFGSALTAVFVGRDQIAAELSATSVRADAGQELELRLWRTHLLGRQRPLSPDQRLQLELELRPAGLFALRPAPATEARSEPPATVYSLRPLAPGRANLRVTLDQRELLAAELTALPSAAHQDHDRDGLPDAAELTSAADREAFRLWFQAIAESLYQRPAGTWYREQHDCAGLLRYAYVEALRRHDQAWRRQHPLRPGVLAPDVARFTYPDIPVLGARPFATGEATHPFDAFATAEVLMRHNTVALGRDREAVEGGDLLFYLHERGGAPSWHSMVLLDRRWYGEDHVVYHTGPLAPDGPGEVRKVRLADLLAHPDERWRPVASNPNFLGYFRWRLLD